MLPISIEEDKEWDMWEEYLLSCDQEDLVQFMMSRMSIDPKFMSMMYSRFAHETENEDQSEITQLILHYEDEVETEMKEMIPDVDYIISFTERFFVSISSIKKASDRAKGYWTVVEKLSDAVKRGAGSFHDEYELLEDEIADAVKAAKALTSQMAAGKEKDAVVGYLKKQAAMSKVVSSDIFG